MFRFVVLACFLATFAAAFTASPSMLSQSRVAAAASPLAVAPMPRVAPGAVVMSGDGEHEVLYESASALELRTLHPCIFLNGGSHRWREDSQQRVGWCGAYRTFEAKPEDEAGSDSVAAAADIMTQHMRRCDRTRRRLEPAREHAREGNDRLHSRE
jgi:hypothetical protein